MQVKTIVDLMNLKVICGEAYLDNEIEGGYIGDLLSFVMSHAKEKNIWITIQGHINSMAVASLLGLSAIVLSENSMADTEMIEKALEEGIPILGTAHSSFDFACHLTRLLGDDTL
ncbi:MAG: hypothetical protein RR618_07290, partial [Cellulosilyticaceae bacterium]